jgi:hypothetical protein
LVKIVGMSDAQIPWPIGATKGIEQLIVYKGLATALRKETAAAVAARWSVSLKTAKDWQQRLTEIDDAKRRPKPKLVPTIRKKLRNPKSTRRRWSVEEDDLIKRLTAQEAASLLGASEWAISRRRKRLGVGLHDQAGRQS